MRDKILEAAETRDLNALRAAIERNETLPLFGASGDRPKSFATVIDFLKALSFDGEGVEILTLLESVLSAPFVKATQGVHVSWVWPADGLAPLPPESAGSQDTALMRWRYIAFADATAGKSEANAMIQRLAIGDDGTWHAFGVQSASG